MGGPVVQLGRHEINYDRRSTPTRIWRRLRDLVWHACSLAHPAGRTISFSRCAGVSSSPAS